MKYFFLFLFFCLTGNVANAQAIHVETRANVGDIPFDPKTDNPNFEVQNEDKILPYNTRCGMLIEGERDGVLRYFSENYREEPIEGVNGYITIRFLVNFKGETDRFRVIEMDRDYQPYKFPESVSSKLLSLTKSLSGWKTQFSRKLVHTGSLPVQGEKAHPEAYDYYQYLLFKIKDGLIETILP